MVVEGLARLFTSSLEELGLSLEEQKLRGDRIALLMCMKGEEKRHRDLS